MISENSYFFKILRPLYDILYFIDIGFGDMAAPHGFEVRNIGSKHVFVVVFILLLFYIFLSCAFSQKDVLSQIWCSFLKGAKFSSMQVYRLVAQLIL